MNFASPEYIGFLFLTAVAFYLTPSVGRKFLLLIASYIFYSQARPWFLLLLLFQTGLVHFSALALTRSESAHRRKLIVTLSLSAGLTLLGVFKYLGFFAESWNSFSLLVSARDTLTIASVPKIILPLGISFYTFQSLSYLIDVYRQDRVAEDKLHNTALYLAFFPQLVMGPIERAASLMPQIHKISDVLFNYERTSDGLRMIGWGLFKKIMIADNLARLTNPVYGAPEEYSGVVLILATYLFGIQIFCDLSAYVDIAIGSAKAFGIRLTENFKAPYFSANIEQFWNRWHITLSSWFRDYVYYPLVFRRSYSMLFLVFVTFIVSGLWHGANWTFVIWGGLHGLYFYLFAVTRNYRMRAAQTHMATRFSGAVRFISILITFNAISIAWIFFRAESVEESFYIVGHLFTAKGAGIADWLQAGQYYWARGIAVGLAVIGLLFVERHLARGESVLKKLGHQVWPVRWLTYIGLSYFVIMFGHVATRPFIYFNF